MRHQDDKEKLFELQSEMESLENSLDQWYGTEAQKNQVIKRLREITCRLNKLKTRMGISK